jgi:hypothetical protein
MHKNDQLYDNNDDKIDENEQRNSKDNQAFIVDETVDNPINSF